MLVGLARPWGEVEALGEADGQVKPGRAQRDGRASSVPQVDLPRYVIIRVGWVYGGPHLTDSTRETHILALKSTPFPKLPLFLMFPKQEQPGAPF